MTNYFDPVSAKDTALSIAANEISAQEAVDACAKRATGVEPALKIFAHENPDLSVGSGPLSGISIGVKDVFDTGDMPTAYNSAIYQDYHPRADAALVSMLREAGATIAGKTVTTEYAFFTPGPTTNPHNQNHTPGGSSSGSAAGVAAGSFHAAIGTQTGGSVIRPASFCGVSGYKPSFRLFPTVGMKCFSWLLDTAGFFAKNARDCAFVAATCSGRDLEVRSDEDATPRIGFLSQSVDSNLSDEMSSALETVRTACEIAGAKTLSLALPDVMESAYPAHAVVQDYECYRALGWERQNHPDLLSQLLQDHLSASADVTAAAYDDARRTANKARKASRDIFADCDILITASAPGEAPSGLASTGNSIMNRLWTLMGVPTVNVPGMMSENGLPLGVQIIAPFGQDQLALQAAHWLERTIANR